MDEKREELSIDLKKVVVQLYQNGEKIADIAQAVNKSLSSIYRVIRKFQNSGNLENRRRSGRPRLVDEREYRRLQRLVNVDRQAPLSEITAKFNENREIAVSKKTVKRRLKEHGFSRGVYRKKVTVKAVNRKKRLSWCREKRWWTVNFQWSKVIFSDECQICVGENKRVYVWRKAGEGWRPDLVPKQNGRKLSVMVWGCLCFDGVGTLSRVNGNINAQKYIEILDDNLWPVLVRHFPAGNYLFQDDNAPVHRARIVQEFIARNRIKNMSWPAQSPDLNIIENVWLYIKRKLQQRMHRINTENDLYAQTLNIWQDITQNYVRNLYQSIPRRILQVIRLKGHLSKY